MEDGSLEDLASTTHPCLAGGEFSVFHHPSMCGTTHPYAEDRVHHRLVWIYDSVQVRMDEQEYDNQLYADCG